MIEVLKQALDALETSQTYVQASSLAGYGNQLDKADEAIAAIKEALAQPEQESVLIDGVAYTIPSKVATEILGLHLDLLQLKQWQEPVAYLCKPDENGLFGLPTPDKSCKDCFSVYRHTQRTWVGLIDGEIEVLFQTAAGADEEVHIRFARAIESKLKEINEHSI